jgi:hypothetical protein
MNNAVANNQSPEMNRIIGGYMIVAQIVSPNEFIVQFPMMFYPNHTTFSPNLSNFSAQSIFSRSGSL